MSHGRNIQASLADSSRADVSFREIPFEPQGLADRLPHRRNWTIRAGAAARAAVRDMERHRPLDALFVHSQVPGVLLGGVPSRVPTIVSLDATPLQIDRFAEAYNHQVRGSRIEGLKFELQRRSFRRASGLVTWSQWAADGLVDEYGVDPAQITVIPPGVDTSLWRRPTPRTMGRDTVRILFVGGSFERKGGDVLLDAFKQLMADPDVIASGLDVQLHLVTQGNPAPFPGVHVHQSLTPNSPELIELFQTSDIFCLPTKADCSPLVLAEAAAAGLPTITTSTGAVAESVLDGTTGHIVTPDVQSIIDPLRRLVLDADHRLALGRKAAAHARRSMDAARNSELLLDELLRVSSPANRSVLLTVSGVKAPNLEADIADQARPLTDYVAMSRAADASLLDWGVLEREASLLTRLIRRVAGRSVALAHHIHGQRHRYDVVITDGEQVGLPLAFLARFDRDRTMRHVMIAHRLSPLKKAMPIKLLGLHKAIDIVLVYSSSQWRATAEMFDSSSKVRLIDFMVDSEFFRPTRDLNEGPVGDRPVLCSAGREFRDYPTMIEAVRDLDVDVVIASASPWSRRPDNAREAAPPSNVTVTEFTQAGLRDQLDASDILVMPLQESDFQAGITTILEAMAMERPVICTQTEGQTDVVIDGVNGRTVPPGDVDAMRASIVELTENPELAREMGRRGRELILERADVRFYAGLFRDMVEEVAPLPNDDQFSDEDPAALGLAQLAEVSRQAS
ncbi:MAG: glycosyltransferase family 4 protein [Actinomycetota bacterium]